MSETATQPGPLGVRCTYLYCNAPAGQRCVKFVNWGPEPLPPARKPHAARVRAAEAAVRAQTEEER